MIAYINLSALIKTATLAFVLLACHGCLVPSPVLPPSFRQKAQTAQIDIGLEKTCYAEALTESEARKITQSSESLETAADKLAAAGKHQEAIKEYNEAGAAALNEAITDGRAEDIENYTGDVENFQKKNRPLVQKSAELNFKVGQSYAQLGKLESALDCFNGTLKIGILPPNDAIAYLNRGDVHERMGVKHKAKADFQQAANLFKKYKLPYYQKLSQKRFEAAAK